MNPVDAVARQTATRRDTAYPEMRMEYVELSGIQVRVYAQMVVLVFRLRIHFAEA